MKKVKNLFIKDYKKVILLGVMTVLFCSSFLYANNSKAVTDLGNYISIKLDTNDLFNDQLWEFQSVPGNHTFFNVTTNSYTPAGTTYECALFLVEEWGGANPDKPHIVWTENEVILTTTAGNSLSSDIGGNYAECCVVAGAGPCASNSCMGWDANPASPIDIFQRAYSAGWTDKCSGTDCDLSASDTFYAPDTEILCETTWIQCGAAETSCNSFNGRTYACNSGFWDRCSGATPVCSSGTCVAAIICDNNGTCAGAETTTNCPADCCIETCGTGCTNAADCMTIEPDCVGACVDATCVTDTDCGYWVCDSGAGYVAEDCVGGGFTFCAGLDGTNCGGGKVWDCSGSCNMMCDPNWFPGGCPPAFPPTPQCLDEYDACDCACVAAGGCNNDGVMNNGETGVDCGGGGCPACVVCVPTGPENCDNATGDEDCDLLVNCADLLDCPNGSNCGGTNFCDSGSCIECLVAADCAVDEVCNSGVCIPCIDEGFPPPGGDPTLCCAGLSLVSGICTSACDPHAGSVCNPLRGTIETLVQGGETFVQYLLGLIGSIALLLIIISGAMYMTSAGSEERIASSKKILVGAVVGLGIALLAYSLLEVIIKVLDM